jgi:predicted phosphate transport protein (TIGR00153 family)
VRLLPRDEQFYDLFSELAKRVTGAARLITKLFEDPAHLDRYASEIKTLEHEADSLTHEVTMRINKSFITPFDREDIHMLASRLDDVIDLIDGTARRAQMFHIRQVREPARLLCDVLSRAAVAMESAVEGMKKSKVVAERAREIKRLEEEGDALYHEAVGSLFSGTPDALEVIKWKELFDTLERALDQCEDVANTLEGISLKNA